MRKYFFTLVVFVFGSLVSYAQKPPSADEVLKTAYQQAARENKNVLLIFHASWCGWCRKMDSSLHDESTRSYFDKNFVITHLTVKESAGKKDLENPGAEDFLNTHGGKDLGLPFWIVLDKNGKVLGDSQIKQGVNTGCPASKEEVAHLITVLEKSSSIKDEEKLAVEKRFRRNE